jgi:hypothetical protein
MINGKAVAYDTFYIGGGGGASLGQVYQVKVYLDDSYHDSDGVMNGGNPITSGFGNITKVIVYHAPSAPSGLVNFVNFEPRNYNQALSTYGLSSNYSNIVSSPVLDNTGPHSLMLSRSGSAENFVIGQGGTYGYNLPTAYYSFLFEYTSNPSEGGICNFQDTGNNFKAALHLSSPSGGYSNIMFYPLSGSGYPMIGSTPLYAGVVYTISAQIGTGQNAPWQVLINGKIEMSGTVNQGTVNNGSINLGGNSNYTDTYFYDDVAIDSQVYAGGGGADISGSSALTVLVSQVQSEIPNGSETGSLHAIATVTSPPYDPPVLVLPQPRPQESVRQYRSATAKRVTATAWAVDSFFADKDNDPAQQAFWAL